MCGKEQMPLLDFWILATAGLVYPVNRTIGTMNVSTGICSNTAKRSGSTSNKQTAYRKIAKSYHCCQALVVAVEIVSL